MPETNAEEASRRTLRVGKGNPGCKQSRVGIAGPTLTLLDTNAREPTQDRLRKDGKKPAWDAQNTGRREAAREQLCKDGGRSILA